MLRRYGVAVGALAAAFGLGLYVGTSDIVSAKSNRLWEIRTYTTAEGKLDTLVKRMGEHEKRMFEKHGMRTELFSVAADAPLSQNTFIYILSHESREAAKKSWDGLRNDPEFKALIEQSGRTTTKTDAVFVTPTDYSPLK